MTQLSTSKNKTNSKKKAASTTHSALICPM